jgi:hypothetical protein
MSQIVCQAYRLGKVNVEAKYLCNGSSNLCHLDAVGKACAVKIIEARCEHLCFAFEATKRRAVNYTVAVTFKIAAVRMRLLREPPATAAGFSDCITG